MTDEALWIAAGSIAQIVLTLGLILSLVIFRADRKKFKKEERDKFYAQLDSTYMAILKMVVDNPRLGLTPAHRSPEEQAQYDAFAFIMWNFLESIYDFCLDDPSLKETWDCILVHESAAHAGWFDREENRRKFKRKFRVYIDDEVFSRGGQAPAAR
jgi:hypothetical protein